MRKWLRTGSVFALVVAALVALSGCPAATATKEKAMTEEPPPPTHVGTWRSQESWIEDGEGSAGRDTADFHEGGKGDTCPRRIRCEQLIRQWAEPHAWGDQGDRTIVKTGLWDHDDDYETPEVHLSPLDKTYYLVRKRQRHLMTPWARMNPRLTFSDSPALATL